MTNLEKLSTGLSSAIDNIKNHPAEFAFVFFATLAAYYVAGRVSDAAKDIAHRSIELKSVSN